jgi:hypothetical protein
MPLPFTHASREQRFWRWFRVNSARLFAFEKDQEHIFDELARELQSVQKNLTFEFGPVSSGRREFIISAGGIHEAFPAVRSLVAAAPALSEWNVIAFRPPKSLDFVVEYGGLRLGADDIRFEAFREDTRIALALYLRGYTPKQREVFGNAAFILLDCALGEYVVETAVGGIDFRPLPPDPVPEHLLPFRDIRAVFDTVTH